MWKIHAGSSATIYTENIWNPLNIPASIRASRITMYQRLRYSSIPFTDAHDFRKFPGTTLWNKFFSSSPLFTMNAQRIREEPLEKTRILPYSDDIVNFQFYWHVVGIRTYIYKYTSTLITRSNDDDREIIARISHGSPCTTCSVSKMGMKRERERERRERERGRKEERKKRRRIGRGSWNVWRNASWELDNLGTRRRCIVLPIGVWNCMGAAPVQGFS